MSVRRGPMPRVTWNGIVYSLKSRKTPIPDLSAMSRLEVSIWLNQNTRPRGYSRPNPLAGLGDAIEISLPGTGTKA